MGSLLERTIGEAKDPDPAESLDSVKKIEFAHTLLIGLDRRCLP